MPIRARMGGDTATMSSPSNWTSPDIGLMMPEMTRSVVVLPAPLAPSRATTSPGATVRFMSRTTAALS